jgi:FKBP-type peptidyl-prolyl cis-trans isomerase FklB
MQKAFMIGIALFFAGSMFFASAQAQQTTTPAASKPPAATAQKPASKAPATPAPSASASSPLTTDKDKRSYAIGMNVGQGLAKNLANQSVEVDPAIVAKGLADALAGGQTLLSSDEAKAVLTQLDNELRAKHDAERQQAGEANVKEGTQFLADNKTKDGVVTLPSGLQYKILTAGTGPKPTASDTVTCQYRGTFINGTEFDSSYKRGQPASFQVGGVIKGWTEALQLMPVGSKWQLVIPPDLAYGANGAGPIGPNATLIFEVELLSIKPKAQ